MLEAIATIKENFQAIDELSVYPVMDRSKAHLHPDTPAFVADLITKGPLAFEIMYVDAAGKSYLINASESHLILVQYQKSIGFNKILLEHSLKELNLSL